jgi:hypothetical protein
MDAIEVIQQQKERARRAYSAKLVRQAQRRWQVPVGIG